jgi:hypothetical protein
MHKKNFFFLILIFLNIHSYISSQSIPNDFLENNSTKELIEIFTINVGIMRFKNVGNISEINPVDADNLVRSIRSTINNITAASLEPESALAKIVKYLEKIQTNKKDILMHLREKVIISPPSRRNKLIQEIMTHMNSTPSLQNIRNTWFENYNKPVYSIKTQEIIEYQIFDHKTISSKQTVQPDILITGEIERIGSRYLIKILFYSSIKDQIIHQTALTSEPDKITETIENAFQSLAKLIFNINYSKLNIQTNPETEIYINNKYIAKESIHIPFAAPGTYLLTLKEFQAPPITRVIEILPNEIKNVRITPDFIQNKQPYYINIEPVGTRIFINSQYRGTTPFRVELPKGEFVLTAKSSDLYEDYRYTLTVNEINSEEKTIQFQLMTKDISDYLKLKKNVYYAAFWSFTFSLTVTVPVTIVAVQYFNAPNVFSNNAKNFFETTNSNKDVEKTNKIWNDMIITSEILRFTSIGLALSTAVSLGWLFYSLFDYLKVHEKKDFIPILNFYSTPDQSGVIIGAAIPIS